MVPLDAGDIHLPYDIQALLGIGIITHYIAETRKVSAFLLLDVIEDDLERVQVGMDIRYDGKLHVASILQFQTREIHLGFHTK